MKFSRLKIALAVASSLGVAACTDTDGFDTNGLEDTAFTVTVDDGQIVISDGATDSDTDDGTVAIGGDTGVSDEGTVAIGGDSDGSGGGSDDGTVVTDGDSGDSDDGSLVADGDTDDSGSTPVDDGTSGEPSVDDLLNGDGLPPLAGGSLAQEIADATLATTNALNGVIPGSPLPFEIDNDDDFAVAPPSIGADVPVTYFGPAPSSTNRNLIGPLQLLLSGVVDLEAVPRPTVTIPLYNGRLASGGPRNGETFLYIVTDTSDRDNAAALGVNFSAKLNFSDLPVGMEDDFMATSVRRGFYDDQGVLVTSGGFVDFTPELVVNPQSLDTSGTSNLLTSVDSQPGSVGSDVGDPDGFYSPLVIIENAGGFTYNASIVAGGSDADLGGLSAYCDGIPEADEARVRQIVHDSVVAICPGDSPAEPGTVTLELATGFSFGRPVLYLSVDTSAALPAALEKANFAPALANIPVGRDDSLFSAGERLFGFTNGPTNDFGEINPQRQGFNSALVDGGGPLNVLGGIPTIATDYSPLWDVNLGEWTQEAIDNGYRSRLDEEFKILGFVQRGFVTGPGGTPYGSSGFFVNCPIVQRLL